MKIKKSKFTYLCIIAVISILIMIILLIMVFVQSGKQVSAGPIPVRKGDDTNMKQTTSTDREFNRQSDAQIGLVTYADGFTYEPITEEIKSRIAGISYPENCPVSLDDLRYVKVRYIDFDGNTKNGELIVAASVAQDIVEIFKELYDASYPIAKIKLIDDYNGDDEASMEDNNSSAFNYRNIDGQDTISLHSYGTAIDINPYYNPYVRTGFGDRDVLPVNATAYVDRTVDFPGKITNGDICYNTFISHGWKWGGDWTGTIDYQHFYKE